MPSPLIKYLFASNVHSLISGSYSSHPEVEVVKVSKMVSCVTLQTREGPRQFIVRVSEKTK